MTKSIEKKSNDNSAKDFYNDLLDEEFNKETDRGAVIFVASLFDINLGSLLKSFLVADASNSDQLFEGATAPLSTFSAKIIIAYRLGLISKHFARDLNLIRKIRNEFAHNIHGCSFQHSSVISRVGELTKSSNVNETATNVRAKMADGTRGDFLINASWMLWSIHCKIEEIIPLDENTKEFGYLSKESLEQIEKEAMREIEENKPPAK